MKKYIKNRKYRTSILDDNIYPALCQAASENPILFSKFRRNSIYNKILEHVTKEQGQEYLTVILQNREIEFSEAEWKDLKKMIFMEGLNYLSMKWGLKVSPTTLRYVKVLQDIMTLFDVEKYYLFDLPEVLQLSRTWLKKTFSEEKEYAKKVEF